MKGCGKDFEVWHYDQDGIPTHSETLECGFEQSDDSKTTSRICCDCAEEALNE
jgi:hypothetical protein